MQLPLWKLLVTATICSSCCTLAQRTKRDYVTKDTAKELSYSVTNVARGLSIELMTDSSKSDIFSPLSIVSSLLLLMRAARGYTRLELLELLQLSEKYQINDPTIPRNYGQLLTELLDDSSYGIIGENPNWLNESKCIGPEEDYSYEDEELPDSYKEQQPEPNIIRLANAIFVQSGMFDNQRLQKVVENLYYSTVESIDFFNQPKESRNHINKWANESTNGRIPEIIADQLSLETTMIVANALYFKAIWEDVFLADATKLRKFFPNGENEESVEVEMMAHGGCFPYFLSKSLDAKIIGFPYANRTTTMYVILPNNSNRAKLQTLMGKLDAPTLDGLISNMTMRTASVLFPKMHIEDSFELKAALQKLGVKRMFQRGGSNVPLFNRLIKGQSLNVGEMLHKVVLDINEKGTEGGAVTATLLDRSMSSVNFRAIAPFLVAIRHDATKLLLFYGPIYDPSV